MSISKDRIRFRLPAALLALWIPATLGLLGGCGDDDPPRGAEGGACYADGTCDLGLTCLSLTCVDAGPCTPDETGACSCPGGGAGTRTCDADGEWGPCGCLEDCGDGTCDPDSEDGLSCPQDCPCGDGVVDDGEECDDGNQEDGDGCSARCEEEICGNGELEGGEVCDGELDAGLTCEDYGYDGGELGCRSDCGPDLTGCYTCGDGTCEAAESPSSCPADCPTLQAVDVLFVVDNSGSMVEEQAQLQADISTFIAELRDPVHGLPDLHVGVTSTDLGTGMFQITYCEDVGGDQGNLLTGSCANPTGAPYLLDVAPQGCNITRDAGGSCTADDCAQQHCPEGTLTADATTGCPRCRNYSGVDLQEAFNCIAALGTLGCGFEQPLEAMHEALDQNTANAGFLRNESILAVMFLTDEDDCSASNPQIFDNSQTEIDSTLGPLTSYRCFEFGVTCDVNDRTHEGERHNCTPRSDADALLHPIDRYTSLLGDLRDPGRVVVSAIAGPVQGGGTVTIGRDEYSQPELQYSCTSEQGGGGAVPGVRLRALVEAVMPPAEMADAYGSICDGTYAIDLGAFAGAIRARMQ